MPKQMKEKIMKLYEKGLKSNVVYIFIDILESKVDDD